MNGKIILIVVSVLAGVIIYTLYPKSNVDDPVSIAPPEPLPAPALIEEPVVDSDPQPAPAAVEPPEEKLEPLIDPPAKLDNSDPVVLDVINNIAPKLSTWLLPEQQVRKWVLTIDLLADGELPKKYPPLNFPMAPFKIEKNNDVIKPVDTNFSRVEPLITTITAIEPKLIARYYQHWLPTFEQAYQEQGKPGSFDQRLRKAIDHILKTKPLADSATLHQPHVFYQYTDPKLEKRSDLDKLMWRLGTENMQRVQSYLQQLQKHL